MQEYLTLFFRVWLKFFFILTPFFIMSVFLSLTKNMDSRKRHITALKVTGHMILVGIVLFFFGNCYSEWYKSNPSPYSMVLTPYYRFVISA